MPLEMRHCDAMSVNVTPPVTSQNDVKTDKSVTSCDDVMDVAAVRRTGTEYIAATARVNVALNTLKKELTAMREQDLRLLKQLIQISETIRRLSSPHPFPGSHAPFLESPSSSFDGLPHRRHRPLSGPALSRFQPMQSFDASRSASFEPIASLDAANQHIPLMRQQSEPRFCKTPADVTYSRLSSASSTEDVLGSWEDGIFSSGSELDESTSSLRAMKRHFRPRSLSVLSPPGGGGEALEAGEDAYADILRRNVRLWKWGLRRQDAICQEETTPLPPEHEADR